MNFSLLNFCCQDFVNSHSTILNWSETLSLFSALSLGSTSSLDQTKKRRNETSTVGPSV